MVAPPGLIGEVLGNASKEETWKIPLRVMSRPKNLTGCRYVDFDAKNTGSNPTGPTTGMIKLEDFTEVVFFADWKSEHISDMASKFSPFFIGVFHGPNAFG